eukprot:COSAG02_NODE_64358_length_260_cov_1.925466_1_plen_30_part_10
MTGGVTGPPFGGQGLTFPGAARIARAREFP